MYELKAGDIIKIKTGGKIREVTITDIMLEAFIESEGRLDWKTTIRFKYGEKPPYISDKKFANSFIEAYNNAVSEMNSIVCNNCLWWNETCHNKKSCCYGDHKDYNGFCGWFEPENAKTNVAAEIFKAQNHDSVNHPSHCTACGIECIDCIKAALDENFMGFLIGNVTKYSYRYRNKNGLEDLKKALWYLDRAIKEVEGNE